MGSLAPVADKNDLQKQSTVEVSLSKASTESGEVPISVEFEQEYFVSIRESEKHNYNYNNIAALFNKGSSVQNSKNASFTNAAAATAVDDNNSNGPLVSIPVTGISVPCSKQLVTCVRYCENSHCPIELCYQCFGDPLTCSSALLLIAGLNMQSTAFDERFCELLVTRQNLFVIRFDNRDIGHSTKIEKRGSVVGARLLLNERVANFLGESLPYHLSDFAKDAIALMDKLGIQYFHVFGISMGGMIAQCVALLAPERVLSLSSLMSTTNERDLKDTQLWVKLWMLRSPPRRCTLEELLNFRVASLRKLLQSALPVDEDYLKYRYLLNLRRSSYSAGLVRQAAAIRRCPGRDASLAKLNALPAAEAGAQHVVPALVIHGAQDLVVPPSHGYRTASVLQHSRMLIFKSMGHYFHPAFFDTIVEVLGDMVGPATEAALDHLNYLNTLPGGADGAASPPAPAPASAPASPPQPPPESPLRGTGRSGLSSGNASLVAAETSALASELAAAESEADRRGAEEERQQLLLRASEAGNEEEASESAQPPVTPVSQEAPAGAAADGVGAGSNMASMSTFFKTGVLVASPVSTTGAAAIKLVNVDVPGVGSPLVPEAVLVDLHDTSSRFSRRAGAPAGSYEEGDLVFPFEAGQQSTWGEAIRRRYPRTPLSPASTHSSPTGPQPSRRLPSLLSPPPSLVGMDVEAYTRVKAQRERAAAEEVLRKKKEKEAAKKSRKGKRGAQPPTPSESSSPRAQGSPTAGESKAEDADAAAAEDDLNLSLVGIATDEEVAATALPPLLPQLNR